MAGMFTFGSWNPDEDVIHRDPRSRKAPGSLLACDDFVIMGLLA
jgi:hypothetical protein